MKLIETISELRTRLGTARADAIRAGKSCRVVFVPTMGALHEGHLQLVDLAKEHGEHTVVSIFVNPIQFNSSGDLAKYPRTLERDVELCRARGVDTVFAPTAQEIYPWASDLSGGASAIGAQSVVPTRVQASSAATGLCGATRPGHFDGVVTVVSILFNLVQPDAAVFGDKDYQQAAVIEQMVEQLHFPVRIIRAPIFRDSDGLALSSRNVLLSAEERYRALYISKSLFKAEELVRGGECDVETLKAVTIENLEKSQGLRIDYVDIVDAKSIAPVTGRLNGPAQLCIAAFSGTTRLIDNIRLTPGGHLR